MPIGTVVWCQYVTSGRRLTSTDPDRGPVRRSGEGNVGPAELTNVTVTVVATTSALTLGIMAFGLFRRRSSVAWESGGYVPPGGTDTQLADPAIARRIAELVPPSDADPSDDEATDPSDGPSALFTPADEQFLSDGSDESAAEPDGWASVPAPVAWPDLVVASGDGPADTADGALVDRPDPSVAWPDADPGVVRPLLDAVAASDPAPAVDREALSRLLTDATTGLGSAVAWELWIAEEDPRERRYRRPTTIVLVELDGLDAVVAVHGRGVAARAAAMIGTTLRANVRNSDRAAVIGPGLYAVLLTETDEIRAVNFVERVRATCESWLATNAPGVGIAFGWASPDGEGLGGARATAHQRLLRDRG